MLYFFLSFSVFYFFLFFFSLYCFFSSFYRLFYLPLLLFLCFFFFLTREASIWKQNTKKLTMSQETKSNPFICCPFFHSCSFALAFSLLLALFHSSDLTFGLRSSAIFGNLRYRRFHQPSVFGTEDNNNLRSAFNNNNNKIPGQPKK